MFKSIPNKSLSNKVKFQLASSLTGLRKHEKSLNILNSILIKELKGSKALEQIDTLRKRIERRLGESRGNVMNSLFSLGHTNDWKDIDDFIG